jgi:hypothetical protein
LNLGADHFIHVHIHHVHICMYMYQAWKAWHRIFTREAQHLRAVVNCLKKVHAINGLDVGTYTNYMS